MGKWSSATVRPLADTRVKSAAGEVCQARVPLLPGGRIMCNVCNLEHWWHLKKYSGKRKAEMNFCGRYQSWRAPWIAIALLAAKLPVSALLLCGRKPRACVSLAPSFSVYFLRGRLVIELYTSRLCTRCTHNLILNALKSKKHATNYQDTLVFFYFFFNWTEKSVLASHSTSVGLPPKASCTALVLTSAICVGMCVKGWGLPVELDLIHSGKMTRSPLAFGSLWTAAVKDDLSFLARGRVVIERLCPFVRHMSNDKALLLYCLQHKLSTQTCFWCLIMFWVITLVSKWF